MTAIHSVRRRAPNLPAPSLSLRPGLSTIPSHPHAPDQSRLGTRKGFPSQFEVRQSLSAALPHDHDKLNLSLQTLMTAQQEVPWDGFEAHACSVPDVAQDDEPWGGFQAHARSVVNIAEDEEPWDGFQAHARPVANIVQDEEPWNGYNRPAPILSPPSFSNISFSTPRQHAPVEEEDPTDEDLGKFEEDEGLGSDEEDGWFALGGAADKRRKRMEELENTPASRGYITALFQKFFQNTASVNSQTNSKSPPQEEDLYWGPNHRAAGVLKLQLKKFSATPAPHVGILFAHFLRKIIHSSILHAKLVVH
ncbi:hypothetical protein NLJ89_g9900 [Agrocybe chaxingu]|uniref:Uncharacterized protein n=1 Tax=Agrocybe chaxingu TaxID=84603 RepID=A0A9W8JRT5_9AGAR|nr:hypothetical protein NLJ89_g9900 [Agrocybe chaxingu]